MRNLTVKRTKSFVACLAKMKIYIEDPVQGSVIINGVPCVKLGDLKNGEEKTFQIGDEAAKVFVIADRLSKGYCNEFYQLPAGQEDIFLSGKNCFNPASGNAFRFDNNNAPEVIENRKRSTRRGLIVFIVAIIVGGMIGFASGIIGFFVGYEPEPESFSAEGINIMLTEEFVRVTDEEQVGGFTVVYDSRDVAVFALEEAFADYPGIDNYTLRAYGDLVIKNNSLTSELKNDGDLLFFEYDSTDPDTGKTARYYAYVYEADDAFWLVQFATLVEDADEYAPKIREWAASVSFD